MTVYLIFGDFRKQLASLKSSFIDMVLTDPPYARNYLPLWSELAKESSRVLKPGAFLVSYSGHKYLPGVMERLNGYLEYHWLGYVLHREIYFREDVGMTTGGKPLLFYQRPPRVLPPRPAADLLWGSGRAKRFHEWEQPVGEARQLIETFSKAGEWVLDPMCGSGTTLLAAHAAGRNAIGCEVDPKTYEVAKARLEAAGVVVRTSA